MLRVFVGGQGAGDILARFRWGKTASAHKLLARVAGVFVETGNIYESYNMSGGRGGDTGGNYLEHCSGYAWTVSEGAFGIDFGSDKEAAATITPRFDPAWPSVRHTPLLSACMPSVLSESEWWLWTAGAREFQAERRGHRDGVHARLSGRCQPKGRRQGRG